MRSTSSMLLIALCMAVLLPLQADAQCKAPKADAKPATCSAASGKACCVKANEVAKAVRVLSDNALGAKLLCAATGLKCEKTAAGLVAKIKAAKQIGVAAKVVCKAGGGCKSKAAPAKGAGCADSGGGCKAASAVVTIKTATAKDCCAKAAGADKAASGCCKGAAKKAGSCKSGAKQAGAAKPVSATSFCAKTLAAKIRSTECAKSSAKLLVDTTGVQCKDVPGCVAKIKAAKTDAAAAALIKACVASCACSGKKTPVGKKTSARLDAKGLAARVKAAKSDEAAVALLLKATGSSDSDTATSLVGALKAVDVDVAAGMIADFHASHVAQVAEAAAEARRMLAMAAKIRSTGCAKTSAKLVGETTGLNCPATTAKLVAAIKAAKTDQAAAKVLIDCCAKVEAEAAKGTCGGAPKASGCGSAPKPDAKGCEPAPKKASN